jgi:WD40 repeat protein
MISTSLSLTADFKLPTGILGASVSDDGTSLVAACMDGIYQADLQSQSSEKIGQHSSYVSSAAFLPERDAVISAGYDGVIQWIDLPTKQQTRKLQLHDFWSWDMAVSPDRSLIASVTGQYLAGGYKYEPLAEREPSVKIVATVTGEVLHSLPHVPSVQAVAFSPDGKFVAAGNLMGEVRVWNVHSGKLAASFTTSDFTSWGIIKSHSYLGGIFALKFTPDGKELLLAGMGPMQDPMAGNGRQLWQKWSWNDSEPCKLDETHKGESGEGLMETVAVHPDGRQFVMGGRLRGGDWNAAMFDLASGVRTATLKTGFRVTEANFTADGQQLILVGAQGQPKKMVDGAFPNFGRVEVYDVAAG